MPDIFDDERRGSGPIAPAPNPGGYSLPPNVSVIPFQTLSPAA